MIIGIDHGYYAIKTKQVCFPTGIIRYEYEPYTMQNVLQYRGEYYVCGTGRQTLVKDKTANHIIYLSGGSGRDKALFAQCVNEFFDVIDNQRYILVKKKGHKGLNGFYAIPNCFSKKKEDAERFAKCMHPYIGNYDCVYTRNEKGRELLLEGRVKALANREERCISHKKVKGALE